MTEAPTRLPVFRLLILAAAIFVSVSSEFLPTGLLPDIAGDLRESEPKVGLLVTIFAGTVVLTATPLTALTRRFPRKWLLVSMLGIFAISNVMAAFAPTYEMLAAARVLGGIAHGVFWGVAGPYTALMVQRHQLARAISITNGGGSLAFVFGVPLTTAIGHALGWRAAFLVMAIAIALFGVLVVLLLPPVSHLVPLKTGEIAVPVRKDRTIVAVAIVGATVLFLGTGHNLFYTYIAPWSISVGGVPSDLVSIELLFFGIAGAVGLLIAGALGDRHPRGLLIVLSAGLVLTMVLLGVGFRGVVLVTIGVFLWSATFGGIPTLMHTRNLHAASPRIRDVAASVMTTAFNLAIGLGSLLGAGVYEQYGIAVLPWVGAGLSFLGLVWILATDRARIRRSFHV